MNSHSEQSLIALDDALQQAVTGLLNTSSQMGSLSTAIVRKWVFSTVPLKRLLHAVRVVGGCVEAPEPQRGYCGLTRYTEVLASCFKGYQRALNLTSAAKIDLPLGTSYECWLSRGGSGPRYAPVHQLRGIINQSEALWARAVVHGSVGTLDDEVGFSDLDLAFVIRDTATIDAKCWRCIFKTWIKILCSELSFDPYMHHGPYWLWESRFKTYRQSVFPLTLFEYAVELKAPDRQIKADLLADTSLNARMLKTFEQYFEERVGRWPVVTDLFEVEWMLGNLMFLPTLYLQLIGEPHSYKRFTFEKARPKFTIEEWGPIVLASAIRKELGPRPLPPKWICKLAFHVGGPNLIVQWARANRKSKARAQDVSVRLGPRFVQDVLALVRSMKKKAGIV